MTVRVTRRGALAGGIVAAGAVALPGGAAEAHEPARGWRAAWGAAMQPAPETSILPPGSSISRTIAPSLSGTAMRLRISNRYGRDHLTVSASVSASRGTFGGLETIAIPPGASAISDPIELPVRAGDELNVAVGLPDGGAAADIERLPGNEGATISRPGSTPAPSLPALLSTVEVLAAPARTIAILGDTKSARPDSWVDRLAAIAQGRLGVVNRSIYGGKLSLGDGPSSGLARFDHDILATPGITDAIVFCGNNDLIQPGMIGSRGTPIIDPALMQSAEQLQALLQQAAMRTRAAGIRAIGATWLPYEGVTIAENYSSPEKIALREEINRWIRQPGNFDAVIDFDAVLRDPARPSRLDPRYDAGNHFTQNAAGVEQMARTALAALAD